MSTGVWRPGTEAASRRCGGGVINSLLTAAAMLCFSGSAPREAARAGSEACQGSRGRVRERESGGKAHFYIEMGLPSHAALLEAGE